MRGKSAVTTVNRDFCGWQLCGRDRVSIVDNVWLDSVISPCDVGLIPPPNLVFTRALSSRKAIVNQRVVPLPSNISLLSRSDPASNCWSRLAVRECIKHTQRVTQRDRQHPLMNNAYEDEDFMCGQMKRLFSKRNFFYKYVR